MSEKTELARAIFESGFNCAQAVFATFAEDYEIDQEAALRVAGGFGAGMRCGEVCGAAAGALMAIGAARGSNVAGDASAKLDCNTRAKRFMEEFRSRHGAILCRDLLGYEVDTPSGNMRFADDEEAYEKCCSLVESAAAILEEFGY